MGVRSEQHVVTWRQIAEHARAVDDDFGAIQDKFVRRLAGHHDSDDLAIEFTGASHIRDFGHDIQGDAVLHREVDECRTILSLQHLHSVGAR